jgi:hypothetical protein
VRALTRDAIKTLELGAKGKLGGDTATTRLMAAKAILDRGWGKPPQAALGSRRPGPRGDAWAGPGYRPASRRKYVLLGKGQLAIARDLHVGVSTVRRVLGAAAMKMSRNFAPAARRRRDRSRRRFESGACNHLFAVSWRRVWKCLWVIFQSR